MDRAFEAVAARDPARWRAILLEEGVSLSFLFRPAGADGDFEMRLRRNGEFIDSLAPEGRVYKERFTGEPVVHVRGPIALVWGEYE